jgi:hypothetical protein
MNSLRSIWHKPSTFMFILAMLAAAAAAQTNTGTITGTVADPTGAVVAKARVTITNTAMGTSTVLETNASGAYVAPSLTAGTYELMVEASGFQRAVRKAIPLHVDERLGIDFSLRPGATTETVDVSDSAPLVDTQSADVGVTVDTRNIEDLPLNGRRYIDLLLLAPGSVQAAGMRSNPREGRINVDGAGSLQNNFVMNGVDNNTYSENAQEGSPQAVRPAPDALQEFKVQTRTYTAEFGWAQGAVVNAQIKSGSNGFHGSAWEFHRDDHLDAADYFAKQNSTFVKPRDLRNQYGFTAGGPVVKNRTFWFFDYEHTHQFNGVTTQGTVPTAAMRTGDFSIFKSGAFKKNFTDPSTIIPQLQGCVDAANFKINMTATRTDGRPCVDPAGAKLLALYPNPNSSANPFQFIGTPVVPLRQDSFDVRLDQRVSDRDMVYGTYDYFKRTNLDQPGPFTAVNQLATGGFTDNLITQGMLGSVTYTHAFSSNLLNDARFGFNHVYANSQPLPAAGDKGPDFGLTNLPKIDAFGLPPINVSGYSKLGTSEWRPQYQITQVYQLLESLSWVKGDHQLKFGFEYKRAVNNFQDIMAPHGVINIPGGTTYTGDGVANLILGLPQSYGATTQAIIHNYMDGLMGYVQDSYRVNPKLAVTYGIRYEFFTPVIERYNATSNFDPTANGGQGGLITVSNVPIPSCTVTTITCIQKVSPDSRLGRALVRSDKNNFAPRLGFSFRAMDRVVLRGGFGIFYQAGDREGSSALIQQNAPQMVNISVPSSFSPTKPPLQFLSDPFPTISPFFNPTSSAVNARALSEPAPYSEQYSFGPEIRLDANTVMEVSYVGSSSHHLRKLYQLNQAPITNPTAFPFPLWGSIGNYLINNGTANYNSLQTQVRRRFSHGLTANMSWTWAKAMGNSTDNLSTGTSSSQLFPQDLYNTRAEYGRLNFDQTHRVVLNWIYDLPVGPGKRFLSNGLLGKVLGDWSYDGIWSYSTGVPITITSNNANSAIRSAAARANCVGNPRPSGFNPTVTSWFDNTAFTPEVAGQFGSCGIGTLSAWNHSNWDLSVVKKVSLGERRNLEFRSEFFNAFNTPQFEVPGNSVTSTATFGRTTQTMDPDRPARVIQLGAKFRW